MEITEINGEMRFEHSYNGIMTVLEGAELVKLNKAFYRFLNQKSAPEALPERILVSALKAYNTVHGQEITEGELNKLSTADARKADLFFRAMYHNLRESQKLAEKKSQGKHES